MSGLDSGAGGSVAGSVELECPNCGHVVRPRSLEALQSKRYFQCSMCFKRIRNPHFVEAQAGPQVQKQGAELQCPKCGYGWIYTGALRRRVVCPRCFKSFIHPSFVAPEPEGVEVQCRKCGYRWKYTGAKRDALATVRCPRCNASNPSQVQEAADAAATD
jgi:predicted RNA-binding Zn-ribbon protein involved in translation (DUF1610 family)